MLLNSLGWSWLSPAFCKILLSVYLMCGFFLECPSSSPFAEGMVFYFYILFLLWFLCDNIFSYTHFLKMAYFLFLIVWVSACGYVFVNAVWKWFLLQFMNKEILCTNIKGKRKSGVNHKWFWTLATTFFQAWKSLRNFLTWLFHQITLFLPSWVLHGSLIHSGH